MTVADYVQIIQQQEKDFAEVIAKLHKIQEAIRKHRDSWLSGDDKCWRDNEELYKLLPEGYTPPERDTFCELKNCIRYVESCHDPRVTYTSPQRRIEELEAELKDAKKTINSLRHRHRELIEEKDSYEKLGDRLNDTCRKLIAEKELLQKQIEGHCERIAKQSDLLSKKADVSPE